MALGKDPRGQVHHDVQGIHFAGLEARGSVMDSRCAPFMPAPVIWVTVPSGATSESLANQSARGAVAEARSKACTRPRTATSSCSGAESYTRLNASTGRGSRAAHPPRGAGRPTPCPSTAAGRRAPGRGVRPDLSPHPGGDASDGGGRSPGFRIVLLPGLPARETAVFSNSAIARAQWRFRFRPR